MQEDHEERADELLKEADKAEGASKDLEDDIREAKSDWDAKKSDQQVPGALDEDETGDPESE
jgi:hypothetical protein